MSIERAQPFRGIAGAACAIDQDGGIVYWSAAARRLLGYSAREAAGAHCYDLLRGRSGPTRCAPTCATLRALRRGKAVPPYKLVLRARSGEHVHVWCCAVPLRPTGRGKHLFVYLFHPELRRAPRLPAGGAAQPPLTRRELEILELLSEGIADSSALAERLGITLATVRNHARNILGKLGAHSKLQALVVARQRGLVT